MRNKESCFLLRGCQRTLRCQPFLEAIGRRARLDMGMESVPQLNCTRRPFYLRRNTSYWIPLTAFRRVKNCGLNPLPRKDPWPPVGRAWIFSWPCTRYIEVFDKIDQKVIYDNTQSSYNRAEKNDVPASNCILVVNNDLHATISSSKRSLPPLCISL